MKKYCGGWGSIYRLHGKDRKKKEGWFCKRAMHKWKKMKEVEKGENEKGDDRNKIRCEENKGSN